MLSLIDSLKAGIPLSAIAFASGLAFSLIYYYLGKIFPLPSFQAKSKQYLQFTLENIVIFAGLFLLASVISGVLEALIGIDDLYSASIIAITKINTLIGELYVNMFLLHIGLSVWMNQLLFIRFPLEGGYVASVSLSVAPYTGASTIIDNLDKAITNILIVYSMGLGRLALLNFAIPMMSIVLPLGLLLRNFPLTKKTGSSLIALSLVAGIVYPLSVLFTDYVLFQIYNFPTLEGFVPSSFIYKPLSDIKDPKETLKELNTLMSVYHEGSRNIRNSVSSTSPFQFALQYFKQFRLQTFIIPLALSIVQTALSISCAPTAGGGCLVWGIITALEAAYVLQFLPSFTFMVEFTRLVLGYLSNAATVGVALFTSLIVEIVISITMYRQLSGLLGGETSLLGLTKIV